MAAATMTAGRTPRGAEGADPAAAPEEAGAPAGKKRKLLVVVGVVAVVAVAALAVPKLTHKKAAPSPKAAALAVANGPIDSLDPVTVNLADGHLLQVGVAVQESTAANAKTITADQPRILDALITVFSGWTYPALLGDAGHEQARNQLEAKMQALFPPVGGIPQVAGVYFTTFVMQ